MKPRCDDFGVVFKKTSRVNVRFLSCYCCTANRPLTESFMSLPLVSFSMILWLAIDGTGLDLIVFCFQGQRFLKRLAMGKKQRGAVGGSEEGTHSPRSTIHSRFEKSYGYLFYPNVGSKYHERDPTFPSFYFYCLYLFHIVSFMFFLCYFSMSCL